MTSSAARIGFIGLGLMGQAFTKRLVQRGYPVTGYDIDAGRVRMARGHGVESASSPAEATDSSDIVLVCVIDTPAVESAVFGPGGVVESGTADKILVDHSTTIADRTRTMASRLLEACGMTWVDAPVSGGPAAAESGTLAIMAGGEEETVAKVRGVMADLAGVFTHMGAVGAGQITKMINQVLVLSNYCVIAEAVKLAEAGGIDAEKIPHALATGHAGSNLLQAILPRIVTRDFAPRGRARQVLKDLDMVYELARSLDVPTPMAGQAATLFRLLCSRGHGELDGGAVFKLYDEPPV